MYVLNLKQFNHQIKKMEAKAIYFFEGHDEMVVNDKHVRPLGKMDCSDNAELLKEVAEFAKMYPTKFTCYVHSTTNAITTHGNKMHVDLALIEVSVAVPITPDNPSKPEPLNRAEIIKEVTEKIALESEANLNLKKLELAESKLDKLENASEKVALLIMSFLEQLTNKMQPAMQGTQETEPGHEGISDIESAIHYLRQMIGDKTLIKLATDIKNDPSLLDKFKVLLS